MARVLLTHDSGLKKAVRCGFSWTVFFFGFLVPLVRGDLKWSVIIALLQLIVGSFTFGVGALGVGLVFSFVYNGVYIKELMEKGYMPDTDLEKTKLAEYGIYQ